MVRAIKERAISSPPGGTPNRHTPRPTTSSHKQYNGRLDFNATSKDLIAFSIYYVPNSSTGINGNGDRLMNLFNSTYGAMAML